jgi:hypothetical protein
MVISCIAFWVWCWGNMCCAAYLLPNLLVHYTYVGAFLALFGAVIYFEILVAFANSLPVVMIAH